MNNQTNIVFVSLALNQSRFFYAVGALLSQRGCGIFHVCFHEGAVRELRAAGCTVFNPFERQPEDVDSIRFEDYAIDNPALLIGHEKAAYDLSDTIALVHKFKGHLAAMDSILDEIIGRGQPVCMIQELGGFTSVLSAYYAARRKGIDNWFIEPSFFRGRVFFTPNTFSAPKVPDVSLSPSAGVRQILEEILDSRTVVIPAKDRLHYRGASKKLLDPKNYRRLIEKLVAKYLRGEQEEFRHIGGHVMRHLRMFFSSRKLSRHYRPVPFSQPFIYYPLHVPADFALTVRSPEYLDQYALIDYLCRIAPLGYRVVIKEHPALVGAVSPGRIKELLARHDNFSLLSPKINNHEVLAAASAVVTVNSKSGAEALLHGTPVVVLGNAFYESCPLVKRIGALADLQPALVRILGSESRHSLGDVLPFFQSVWDSSCPGELYDVNPENVLTFSDSLIHCLGRAISLR